MLKFPYTSTYLFFVGFDIYSKKSCVYFLVLCKYLAFLLCKPLNSHLRLPLIITLSCIFYRSIANAIFLRQHRRLEIRKVQELSRCVFVCVRTCV